MHALVAGEVNQKRDRPRKCSAVSTRFCKLPAAAAACAPARLLVANARRQTRVAARGRRRVRAARPLIANARRHTRGAARGRRGRQQLARVHVRPTSSRGRMQVSRAPHSVSAEPANATQARAGARAESTVLLRNYELFFTEDGLIFEMKA
jgi:hypothetical protein